jgi:HAE1 family hydrophobic/amphiphilic exporter-1
MMWPGGYGEQTHIDVYITLPRGSDLDRADELARYFEDKLAKMPEVAQYTTDVTSSPSSSQAYLKVTFPDSLENTAVPVAIKEEMTAYSHQFTGADVRVYGYGPSFYGGGGSAPNFAIQVLGYNYEKVRDIAEDLGRRLSHLSRVSDVDTNSTQRWYSSDRASEFAVTVDRARLARYDMSVQEFIARLTAAVVGRTGQESRLKLGGDDVYFEVKLANNRRMDVHALRETLISTPDGRQVRLGDMVHIDSRDVLSRIVRENQQYQRTVAYEFRGPQKLGNVVNDAVIATTQVPPGYTVKKSEYNFQINSEQKGEIRLLIAVSLLLVYMVTAALFESLLQPLCVMLTVPMALIGVYLVFFYTGVTFTREAYIGVIMMFGIVVNNAILLVDHVNGVRAHDPAMPLADAIVKGTIERVRPILMTTATTVAGLLPLLLGGKPTGQNIWDALALVLIGGLLSSTLFVLTITPAVYGVLEGWKLQVRGVARDPSEL